MTVASSPHGAHRAKASFSVIKSDSAASLPVIKPGKGPRHVQPRQHPRRALCVAVPQAADSRPGTVLVCSSVEEWLMDQCDGYRCMRVPRPLAWGDVQYHADLIANSPFVGIEKCLGEERVMLAPAGSEWQFATDLSARARRFVERVPRPGLPQHLLRQIQLDIEEVGSVLARMLPNAEELMMKLELFGENGCSRWHQDNYVCRAIITYNGPGTDFVEHRNVNFWELENCGNNDHILLDKSQVLAVNAADVFLIKGKLFPGAVNGIVHKSPEKRYHADGTSMHRLCLKLDVA